MTQDKLVEELDRIVKVPGLANIWVPPIRNRIDMLATGIKSPVGVKVAGADLAAIDRVTGEIEARAEGRAGRQQRAGRAAHRRALCRRDDRPRRGGALRHEHRRRAVGHHLGGGWRQHRRDGRRPAALPDQPALPARDPRLAGKACAACRSSPNAARGWCCPTWPTSASPTARPCCAAKTRACRAGSMWTSAAATCAPPCRTCSVWSAEKVKLPPGYSISWSGQFEFLERATAKLKVVVPFTLLIIFVLLYLTFKRFDEALLIMATLAVRAGRRHLAAVPAELQPVGRGRGGFHRAGRGVGRVRRHHAAVPETGLGRARSHAATTTTEDLLDAIREGAVLRVRPKAMTVAVILAGPAARSCGAPAPARK